MGGRGTLALTGRDEMHVPAFAVEAVDTTGAGDAFRAGLVSGWLAHGDRADAEAVLAHANATAALNCRAFGAQTGLPGRAAVETLVTERRDGQSK
jgi:sugar/nucleoside kinase (ribokinase family)